MNPNSQRKDTTEDQQISKRQRILEICLAHWFLPTISQQSFVDLVFLCCKTCQAMDPSVFRPMSLLNVTIMPQKMQQAYFLDGHLGGIFHPFPHQQSHKTNSNTRIGQR
jgi:hypothetical protein